MNKGANSYSQLGLDRKTEYELPTEVSVPSISIKKISAGARHTILLDIDGDLHVAGKIDISQNGYYGTFTLIKDLKEKFKDVVCGFDTTAALTEDNRLLVWGNNKNNQLGIANLAVIREPAQVSLPDNQIPMNIRFGLKHTVIHTKSNRIYIVGVLKHFKDAPYKIIVHNSIEWLQLMTDDNDIAHIACGQNHTTFVSAGHVINGFGDNKFGQASQIKGDATIFKFESGWTHNGYLTESNSLWMYGRNNYGQLGTGKRDLNGITKPQKCSIFPVEDFAIGAEHCILKSGTDVYTWGWNEHRNCGHDMDDDV